MKVMENKFTFEERKVYCYNCRTKMAFNGYAYECSRCGSIYESNISEA